MPAHAASYLIHLLNCLEGKEKFQFRKWHIAEVQKDESLTIQLLEIWLKSPEALFDSQLCWNHLFPDIPLHKKSEAALRRIRNRLGDAVKRYLSYQYFQDQQHEGKHALLETLLKAKETELYLRHYRKFLRELDRRAIRTSDYFENRYRLQSRHQGFLAHHSLPIEQGLMLDLSQSLELWQLHERLMLAVSNLSLAKTLDLESQFTIDAFSLERARAWTQKSYLPGIELYLILLQALEKDPNADLIRAQHLLKELKEFLKAEEKENHFRLLLNQSIREVNKRAAPHATEALLRLSFWGIEQNMLQNSAGHIPLGLFKAFIEASIRTEGPQVARQRLQEAGSWIAREDFAHLAPLLQSHIFLAEKAFDLAEACLIGLHFQRSADQVRARMNCLCCGIMLRPENLEEHLLEAQALLRFVNRKGQFSQTLKERYQQQLKWTVRLLKKWFDKDDLERLMPQLKADRNHPFSAWLYQLVKERVGS